MKIVGHDRMSRLSSCLAAARSFLLSEDRAVGLIERQVGAIRANWSAVCREASRARARNSCCIPSSS
jgi:serine/threonine-protein kinase HipA